MYSFTVSYMIGNCPRCMTFDALSTAHAISIAKAWSYAQGSIAYTLRATGDFKRLAA